tara:strand:+ start:855 stop:1073 length:219 start_codon:yes stop_codon:yes gene_type:complete
MQDGDVVYTTSIDEYVVLVVKRGSGFTWKLRNPSFASMSPSPTLESLQLYVDVPTAVLAAKEAYDALPLVVA